MSVENRNQHKKYPTKITKKGGYYAGWSWNRRKRGLFTSVVSYYVGYAIDVKSFFFLNNGLINI